MPLRVIPCADYLHVRNMSDPQVTCPVCGGELIATKSIRISFVDLIGCTVLSVFLLGAIIVVVKMLGLWGFVFACALVATAWYLVKSYGSGVLSKPFYHNAAFAEGWLLGIVLFALGAVWRLFFWREIKLRLVCAQCGYERLIEK